jgi:hypothetical protein
MFIADSIIDTVQTSKKTFINSFVTNDVVKEALINFVDAQGEYTKQAAKIGTDTFATMTSETVKAVQEATKFDFTKFSEGITKKAYSAKK